MDMVTEGEGWDSKFQLKKNDILFLYSDGLAEASVNNRHKDYFDLKETILRHHGKTLKDIVHHILVDMEAGGYMNDDDITMLLLRKTT